MGRCFWMLAAVPVALVSAWLCVALAEAQEAPISSAACAQYDSCPEYETPQVSLPGEEAEFFSSPPANASGSASATALASAPATPEQPTEPEPSGGGDTASGVDGGADDDTGDGTDDDNGDGSDEDEVHDGDEGTDEPNWVPDGTRVAPGYYREFECGEDKCGAKPVPDGWECVKFQTAQQRRPASPFYARTYIECKHPEVEEKDITTIGERYCYYSFDSDGRLLDRYPCGPPADAEVGKRADQGARDTTEALARTHDEHGSGASQGGESEEDGGNGFLSLLTLTTLAQLDSEGTLTDGEGEPEEDELPPTEPVRRTLTGSQAAVLAGKPAALKEDPEAAATGPANPQPESVGGDESGGVPDAAFSSGGSAGPEGADSDEEAETRAIEARDEEMRNEGETARGGGPRGQLQALALPAAGLTGEVGGFSGSVPLVAGAGAALAGATLGTAVILRRRARQR